MSHVWVCPGSDTGCQVVAGESALNQDAIVMRILASWGSLRQGCWATAVGGTAALQAWAYVGVLGLFWSQMCRAGFELVIWPSQGEHTTSAAKQG
jgi:hypothetical protein